MDARGTRGQIGGHDLKGQGIGFGFQPPALPASSIITAVQQQEYSAAVWLRRREKLEHSQQKCIVIFALVCCFAVLMALIFSAVDIWGEEEETEEDCSSNCSAVLVENIPADLLFSDDSTFHLPLSIGLNNLLDQAKGVVEIVSPVWLLSPSDSESRFYHEQGKALLSKLKGLKHRGIKLRISTGEFNTAELKELADNYDAEVHEVNMTALTKGFLNSSFWVVDRKHFYIGSASMDWRSLATRKELGIVVYDCKPLALDLHKVFNLYWGLQHKTFVPTFWSKRLFPFFNRDKPGSLLVNHSKVETYISSSPDAFITKDRSSDLDAISSVIQQACHFIYISIIDYLPLVNMQRYWSRVDGLLREALILRKVHVRLLISCWEETHPLTFNFIWSLKSLCMEQANCSLEAKFFNLPQDSGLSGMNHNRFMVTDKAIYIGNLDWVGREFIYNAGAGLVISHPTNVTERNSTVVEQLQAVFNRDWFSRYANTLQANKTPVCGQQQINKSTFLKASHRNEGLFPGHYGKRPAPLRNHPKPDGPTPDKRAQHEDRLRKMISQSLPNVQGLVLNNHRDSVGIKTNDSEDEHAQVKDWKLSISEDPPSRWGESSGFREISNGSL